LRPTGLFSITICEAWPWCSQKSDLFGSGAFSCLHFRVRLHLMQEWLAWGKCERSEATRSPHGGLCEERPSTLVNSSCLRVR
jgi:hypothetical protein